MLLVSQSGRNDPQAGFKLGPLWSSKAYPETTFFWMITQKALVGSAEANAIIQESFIYAPSFVQRHRQKSVEAVGRCLDV